MIKCDYRGWDDINLTLYYKLREILTDEADEELAKEVRLLALLYHTDEEFVWNAPMEVIGEMKANIKWLGEPIYDKDYKFKKQIRIGDRDYILNLNQDAFTYAQYVDFQTIYNIENDNEGRVMAIFLCPKGYKYNDGYDIADEIKYIEDNCSIKLYYSILNFFCQCSLNFISRSQAYLTTAMKLTGRARKIRNRLNKMQTKVTNIFRWLKR